MSRLLHHAVAPTSLTDEPSPANKISLSRMENHDEAYQVWRHAQVRDRILVHLDAHDDFVWAPNQAPVTIANFICHVLREGLVREFIWVVPDRTWERPENRKLLWRRLRTVLKRYPGEHHLVMSGDHIAGAVLGKPFRACTLPNLPRFSEPVLLDIDVDFLVIPKVGPGVDQHGNLPWCWPKDLVPRLKACRLETHLITIAYSVEGGYTPLKWKFLGDELALRLASPGNGAPFLEVMELVGQAAVAGHHGDWATAEATLLEARARWPESAVPEFHLAHLYGNQGQKGKARECYQRALEFDPTYRTAYNSGGWWYLRDKLYAEAEREYRRTLDLDPNDPYAHLGLGQLAAHRRSWTEAEVWLRSSLELNCQNIDAHRALGEVLTQQGRYQEALQAHEASLVLGLAGHKPLCWAITSQTDDGRLADPEHFPTFARMARLHELLGDLPGAIMEYRLSMGDGRWASASVRARLARLYLRQGQWADGLREAGGALTVLPRDVWHGLQRTWSRLAGRFSPGLPRLRSIFP